MNDFERWNDMSDGERMNAWFILLAADKLLRDLVAAVDRCAVVGHTAESYYRLRESAAYFEATEYIGRARMETPVEQPCFTCGGHGRIDEIRIGNTVNIPCPDCSTVNR